MADLEKLDQKTHRQLIYETHAANQFTSRLQLKLLMAEKIGMMFAKDLALDLTVLNAGLHFFAVFNVVVHIISSC